MGLLVACVAKHSTTATATTTTAHTLSRAHTTPCPANAPNRASVSAENEARGAACITLHELHASDEYVCSARDDSRAIEWRGKEACHPRERRQQAACHQQDRDSCNGWRWWHSQAVLSDGTVGWGEARRSRILPALQHTQTHSPTQAPKPTHVHSQHTAADAARAMGPKKRDAGVTLTQTNLRYQMHK